MLNRYINFSPQYDLVIKLAISLVLTCGLGPLVLKSEGLLPITMQTFFLLFFAIGFGWQVGGLNALLYTLFGMAGLPIFSGYVGGHENVLGPSGGFFFGFIAAALISGFISDFPFAKNPFGHFANWLLGHAIILMMGAFWLKNFRPDNYAEDIRLVLPGAAIKSAAGFLLMTLSIRLLAGRNAFYNKNDK